MANVGHGSLCHCADCRVRRAKEHNAAAEKSRRTGSVRMKKSDGLTSEELTMIEHYPAESVVLMREGGYNTQDIWECLSLAFPEATKQSLGELFDYADREFIRKRRGRGMSRIVSGVAAIAIALLVGIPLVMFVGLLAFIVIIGPLWGVVQIIMGAGDLRETKDLTDQRKLLTDSTY